MWLKDGFGEIHKINADHNGHIRILKCDMNTFPRIEVIYDLNYSVSLQYEDKEERDKDFSAIELELLGL